MPHSFNVLISLIALMLLSPVLIVIWLLAALSTRSNGIFLQTRVGQHGTYFTIYKFRSMKNGAVTRFGRFLRKTKLDELPQLINIIKGDMAIVGPRPDVPGYYDQLPKKFLPLLVVRPGLTSPAAIKYANEEALLAQQADPKKYNDTVLFPDKLEMNLQYARERSFAKDLNIIWRTIASYLS